MNHPRTIKWNTLLKYRAERKSTANLSECQLKMVPLQSIDMIDSQWEGIYKHSNKFITN